MQAVKINLCWKFTEFILREKLKSTGSMYYVREARAGCREPGGAGQAPWKRARSSSPRSMTIYSGAPSPSNTDRSAEI